LPTEKDATPEYVIPLATPIYSNGEFAGVLAAAISLSDLSEKYLVSLKIVEHNEIFLLSNDGTLLHAPYDDLIGINFYEFLEKRPYPGSESLAKYAREKLEKKEKGSIKMIFPASPERKPTPMLTAYAPIEFNDAYWMLALAIPLDEALSFAMPFFINQLGTSIMILLATILFVIVVVKTTPFVKNLWNTNKFIEKTKKRWKKIFKKKKK